VGDEGAKILTVPVPDDSAAVHRLREALLSVEEAQVAVQESVDDLRALGKSWRFIADIVGIAPHSAHKKWTETGKLTHREAERRRRERLVRADGLPLNTPVPFGEMDETVFPTDPSFAWSIEQLHDSAQVDQVETERS
jgi:hypothetical protein